MPAEQPYDPYAEQPPSWLQKHSALAWAAVVFAVTSLLLVLSFPPYDVPEFAYACLVPGIFWAYLRPPLKLYIWTMFAAQALAWTVLLGWLHHVTWLGLFLLGPFVGAWTGVWYLAAWWTMPRIVGRMTPVRLLAVLALAGAWVIVEWSRTWLLGGFPWLPLAASQWQRSSILQIAAYTGASGVSFVLVVVNIGFAAYAHRLFREGETGLRKRSQEFFLALFLLLVCLSVHVQETFNRATFTVPLARVAFVQPDIPQTIKWDPARGPAILDVLEKTTLEAASNYPDFVLWPEATTPWAVRGDERVRTWIESLVRRTQVPLVLGSDAIEHPGQADEAWFNAACVVDPATGLQPDYYAKRHLVPFGEYVPLRPILGWLKKIVPVGDSDYARGREAQPLIVNTRAGVLVLGPLICYEDIFPSLARDNVRAGADALIVLTNEAWFGQGGGAYQHAAHSVLRAVETRRPVLRCGNAGWSGWIDEFGNVRAVLTDDQGSVYFRGTQTINITRDRRWIGRESYYTQHGDWFVAVCAGLVLLGVFLLSNGRTPVKKSGNHGLNGGESEPCQTDNNLPNS
ncbi:MAG: apolipoprotein N-acyltransferase [Verrucomicrobiota bacterium]|nr:apolipoprotein N-acyltransferase [Verrucomicrobiota bacterium]